MQEKFAASSFADFEQVQELYRSSSGAVYRAVFRYDRRRYVLKERRLSELGREKDVLHEARLLSQLRHTNVVRCEGWFRDSERHTLVIVLEDCAGGDLAQWLRTRQRERRFFTESEVWFIFAQVCAGIYHLHENGIVHRDIKPLNVLMDETRHTFKISDLGVSRQLSARTDLLHTMYGTPLYLSPELVENKAYNEKTDLWSLGVLLYELCALVPPFRGTSLLGVAQTVLSGQFDSAPLALYGKEVERCVRWLLRRDYRERPNMAQLCEFVRQRVAATQTPMRGSGVVSERQRESVRDSGVRNVQGSETEVESERERDMDEDSLDPSPRRQSKEGNSGKGIGRLVSEKKERKEENYDTASVSSTEGSLSRRERQRKQREMNERPRTASRRTETEIGKGNNQIDSRPRTSQRERETEKDKVKGREEEARRQRHKEKERARERVPVDLPRCHARYRQESLRLRKLLQTRDLLPNAEHAEEVQGRLAEAQKRLSAIEEALQSQLMERGLAESLGVLLIEKQPEIEEKREAVRAAPVAADDMPVYFQPPPRVKERAIQREKDHLNNAPSAVRSNENSRRENNNAKAERRPNQQEREQERPREQKTEREKHRERTRQEMFIVNMVNGKERAHQSRDAEECGGLQLPSMQNNGKKGCNHNRVRQAWEPQPPSPIEYQQPQHEKQQLFIRPPPRPTSAARPRTAVSECLSPELAVPSPPPVARQPDAQRGDEFRLFADKDRFYAHRRLASDVTDPYRPKTRGDVAESDHRMKKVDVIPAAEHPQALVHPPTHKEANKDLKIASPKTGRRMEERPVSRHRRDRAVQSQQRSQYNIITGE